MRSSLQMDTNICILVLILLSTVALVISTKVDKREVSINSCGGAASKSFYGSPNGRSNRSSGHDLDNYRNRR